MSGVFQWVPAPATGAILGKTYLSVLADNDRHFIGIAEAHDPIPQTITVRWLGEEHFEKTIWDGWLYYDTDRDSNIYYWFQVVSDSVGHPTTVKLYVDEVAKVTISGIQIGSGSFAGPSTTGLYRVRVTMNRIAADKTDSATVRVVPPWVVYGGPYSYSSALLQFVDGVAANTGNFTALCNNDLYFADNVPPQVAGHEIEHWDYRDSASNYVTIWESYLPYDATRRIIYYDVSVRAWSDTNAGGCKIQLLWDADGASPQTLYEWEPSGDVYERKSGSATLDPKVAGTRYWLRVRLSRTNTDYGGSGSVHMMAQGRSTAVSYTDPREYAVGQFVYGNTPGQRTALNSLASTDVAINGALVYKKYACRQLACPPEHIWGPYGDWAYALTRRGDFLYYRGRGGKLWFIDDKKQASLADAGTEENPDVYKVLDLNSVSGLHYGMRYTITGVMDFAMET